MSIGHGIKSFFGPSAAKFEFGGECSRQSHVERISIKRKKMMCVFQERFGVVEPSESQAGQSAKHESLRFFIPHRQITEVPVCLLSKLEPFIEHVHLDANLGEIQKAKSGGTQIAQPL